MVRSARSARNRPRSPGPSTSAAATLIAVLIGVSLPFLYAGFVESFYQMMDFTPLTFRLAVAAVLFSTALGPRLPGRAVLLIARAARRPLTGPVKGRRIEEITGSDPVSAPPSVDQALLWTASGVAGLAAGVGALLLPVMIATVGHLWKWGLSRFLWMNWPLTVFEGLILLLASLVPFVLLGFFMRCVHQLACPAGRWNFGVFGWVLAGAALGFVGVACFCGHPLNGLLLLRVGAVPLLLAAMLSVSRASPSAARQPLADERLAVDEPDLGERWSAVLQIAVAVCVSGTLTAGLVWTYVVGVMHTEAYAATLLAGGAMTFSAAVGLWAGSRRVAFVEHEIGRVGQHCAIAGVSVALGVAVLNVVTRASYAPFLSTPGYWLLWGLCACLPLGLAGYAIGQGGMAVLRRSPCRVRTGSGLLRMVFLAAAFTSLGVALPLLEALGSYATLVAAALALLATGGILIIHEPSFATGRARVRVATVFTAVLLMTWLMPAAGAGWLSTREHSRGRLVESWWLTYDVGPMGGARLLESTAPAGAEVRAAATTFPAHALDWSRLAPPCRVGVVSLLGDDRSWVPPTFEGRVSRLLLAPFMWSRLECFVAGTGGREAFMPRTERVSLPAWRSLRASPQCYDLLAISLWDMPAWMMRRALTSSVLEQALGRLSPDGVMVVLLPREQGVAAEVTSLLTGVSRRRDRYLGWMRLPTEGEDCLAVFCGFGGGCRENARNWSAFELATVDDGLLPAEWVGSQPAPPAPHGSGDEVAVAARR